MAELSPLNVNTDWLPLHGASAASEDRGKRSTDLLYRLAAAAAIFLLITVF